jgi:serine/threonine-protein kinase
LIGQTVGNYLVTQKLGEGGMGAVYLAEHPSIGKKVALKVLHPEFATNEEVAQRFFNEAKAVNAIGHPNIVDIIDYGVIQAGASGKERMVYFIMEYLAGTTLSQVIRTDSPMPPERALMIALQAGDALAAAHRAGIVHRDLKPDNMILIQRGRDRDFVKLLDFGIAKLTGDSAGSHRTKTGLVLGTPAYMSPEQCEGRANVDHRTDVYALGIVLYEMLVGRVPFIGEGYGEILVQHLTQRPIEPSRYRMMSPHVEVVVLKALEKMAQMRYPTMDEFMRAMSDPVGFVEAHGGVPTFLQTTLMPSSAPLPPIRPTPGPLNTPLPMYTPPPGTLSPVPTTLGAAAGQAVGGKKNMAGFVVAGVAVVAAAIVAIVFVTRDTSSAAKSGSADDPKGSAIVADKGSAIVEHDPKGSAAVATDTGSAKTVMKGSADTGSATIVEPTTVELKITSTPPGAEILANEFATGKKTPATLTVPRNVHQQIALRLKGYEDKTVDVDPQLPQQLTVELKKKHGTTVISTGKGSASTGKGSASTGKGNTTTQKCDTCLERPD